MARLNLSLLALVATAAADCTVTNFATETTSVPVYGAHHTGSVVNTYVTPTGTATFAAQPTFDVLVPLGKYPDAVGFNVDFSSVSDGLTLDTSSIALFSGDLGDFAQLNPDTYTVYDGDFQFLGLSEDPLFKYTITGDITDMNLDDYSVVFTVYINNQEKVSAQLTKRDLVPIEVKLTVVNDTNGSSSVSSAVTSASSAVSTVSSSVTSSEVSSSDAGSSVAGDVSSSSASSAVSESDSTITNVVTPTVTTGSNVSQTYTVYSTVKRTITSCSDNKCSTSVEDAVVATVPVTIDDVVTYTVTTCPLSELSALTTNSVGPTVGATSEKPHYSFESIGLTSVNAASTDVVPTAAGTTSTGVATTEAVSTGATTEAASTGVTVAGSVSASATAPSSEVFPSVEFNGAGSNAVSGSIIGLAMGVLMLI